MFFIEWVFVICCFWRIDPFLLSCQIYVWTVIGSVPGHLLCFCRDYSDFLHFIPIILFLFLLICVFSFFLCQLVRGLLILLISFKIQVFCFIGSSVFSFLTSLNSAIIFTISFPLLALCLFCSYFSSFLRWSLNLL